MSVSVKEIINEVGIPSLVKATGFTYSTLKRWRDGDSILGKPGMQAAKLERLKQAAEEVKASRAEQAA